VRQPRPPRAGHPRPQPGLVGPPVPHGARGAELGGQHPVPGLRRPVLPGAPAEPRHRVPGPVVRPRGAHGRLPGQQVVPPVHGHGARQPQLAPVLDRAGVAGHVGPQPRGGRKGRFRNLRGRGRDRTPLQRRPLLPPLQLGHPELPVPGQHPRLPGHLPRRRHLEHPAVAPAHAGLRPGSRRLARSPRTQDDVQRLEAQFRLRDVHEPGRRARHGGSRVRGLRQVPTHHQLLAVQAQQPPLRHRLFHPVHQQPQRLRRAPTPHAGTTGPSAWTPSSGGTCAHGTCSGSP
jgi:hypothetical protein